MIEQQRKKRTRRSQWKNNIWRNTKIMMVNVRGFKCKENSINEIVKENKPTIIMIMETMCEKNELHIDGYAIETTKKRKDKWGGILFAIRKEFEHQVEIVSESIDPAEVLFVQLTCGRMTATIGLVYAPQENDLTVCKMDEMYKYISDEVGKAAADGHVVILGGDFNCKIGESID